MFVRSLSASTAFALSVGATALLAACSGDGGGSGGDHDATTPTTPDSTSTTTTPSDTTSTSTPSDTTSTSTPSDTTRTSTPSDTTSTSTDSGPGCAELCATLNECPDISPSDCATECLPIKTLNEAAGCAEEYKAEVECIVNNATPCESVEGECKDIVQNFITCISGYCAKNFEAPGCM